MEQLARVSNVYSCLNFVSCEHPKLNSCLLDIKDGLADVFLQLVFDSC